MKWIAIAGIVWLTDVQSFLRQTVDPEKVRVAEDVVAFLPSERGIRNCVIVFGDDAIHVVETTATPAGALSWYIRAVDRVR